VIEGIKYENRDSFERPGAEQRNLRTGRRDTMVHDEQAAQAGAASLDKKGRRGR
jgi:hypothetical protein